MPLKTTTQASHSPITFVRAKSVVDQLSALGVPVTNLREYDMLNGVNTGVSTTDEDYFDDGQPHSFAANVWGVEEDLGLLAYRLGKGGFNAFFQLAEETGVTQDPQHTAAAAYANLLSLKGVYEALDKILIVSFAS